MIQLQVLHNTIRGGIRLSVHITERYKGLQSNVIRLALREVGASNFLIKSLRPYVTLEGRV